MSAQKYRVVDPDNRDDRGASYEFSASFVLADRERELLDIKGPCRVTDCKLHYAHYGPCNISKGAGHE